MRRNFTKSLPGFGNLNYIDRLRICNIESLELRRLRSDMRLFINYCIALLNVIYLNLLRFLQIFTILEAIAVNFKRHAHLIIRLNFFVIRCVNNWNLLNNIFYVHILLLCIKNVYYPLINLLLEGML